MTSFMTSTNRVEELLAAGIRLVWVINPQLRTVEIHRPGGKITKLYANDELTGEDVIPGFRCHVADLFPTPEQLAALTSA